MGNDALNKITEEQKQEISNTALQLAELVGGDAALALLRNEVAKRRAGTNRAEVPERGRHGMLHQRPYIAPFTGRH